MARRRCNVEVYVNSRTEQKGKLPNLTCRIVNEQTYYLHVLSIVVGLQPPLELKLVDEMTEIELFYVFYLYLYT